MEKKRIKKTAISKPERSLKKNQSKKSSRVVKTSRPVKITDEYFEKKTIHSSFNFLGFMNDFAQALIITSVFILLTVSFIIVGGQKKSSEFNYLSGQGYFDILSDTKVVKKDKGFFGTLNFSSAGQSDLAGGRQSDGVLGMGSTGNIPTIDMEKDISSVRNDLAIIYPGERIEYNYIYVGEDFNLLPEEVDVYRRVDLDLSRQFANLFSDKKISFFDLRKFRNININNLTINEDREYGYSIYLGLKDGQFSLYKNWEKWPNIDKLCRGYNYECYQSYSLTINDVLSDEDIIGLSDDFLREYGISLDNYGAGEVQKYWMRDYILSEDKASFYMPESIMVTYPLLINGLEVYEESGEKVGLNVEVDMREKRVAGVHNLFYQHYESSAYNSENDKENILKMVENGGIYSTYDYYGDSPITKTIDIQIGTPAIKMVRVWNYDEMTMRGYEIYVPAYVFPVISESEPSYFYRKNIVIPAVKDFFNNNRAYPLPIMYEDSVDGGKVPGSTSSSGSAGSLEFQAPNKD
jgi:hypothetical protein